MLDVACWLAIATVAIWGVRLGSQSLARVERLSREQIRGEVNGWDDHA